MSIHEQKLAKKRLLGLDNSERLFRCHPGKAWKGVIKTIKGLGMVLVKPAPIELLPVGVPDFCGWKSVEVTPEMVGKTVAVFVGEEHKATRGDKMRRAQLVAKRVIVRAGGIHRVVRHDETVEEVRGWE